MRGLRGLGIWLARRLNEVLGRRGQILADRYHTRALSKPREVLNALVYVPQNHLRHERKRSNGSGIEQLALRGRRGGLVPENAAPIVGRGPCRLEWRRLARLAQVAQEPLDARRRVDEAHPLQVCAAKRSSTGGSVMLPA